MGEGQTRILLAEDDANLRRSAVSTLKATDWEVCAASDFESARKLLDESSFDLALVGTRMDNGPSGFVLIREIRSRDRDLPVVAFVEPELDHVLSAFRLGVGDVVVKPVRPSELLCVVQKALGISAAAATVLGAPQAAPPAEAAEQPAGGSDEAPSAEAAAPTGSEEENS